MHLPLRRRRLLALPLLGAASALSRLALAQGGSAFPNRPLSLIVPFPPGGPIDRHARLLSELLSPLLGQPIHLDHRPGAAGTLGPAQMAATVRPDGHTLSIFPPAMLRLPHLQKTAWHPLRDFSLVASLAVFRSVLLVRGDAPWADLGELLRKERTGLSFGTAGVGSSTHVVIEQLCAAAGVSWTHVPFKGTVDLMQALLGGHIALAGDIGGWEALAESGRLRVLAHFGSGESRRHPRLPSVRSFGWDIVADLPYGLAGPAGLDEAVQRSLQAALRQALADRRHDELMDELNLEPRVLYGADYLRWATGAFEREAELVQRLHLR